MTGEKKAININVVDSIMGSGKTQAAINYMNNSGCNEKFIYITPYLTEVKRIIENCPRKNFKQPNNSSNSKSKLSNLKKLLNYGANIATTHALFHLFDEEVIDLCHSMNYTLIMDEVTDVVDSYDIGKDDLENLLNTYVEVKEHGFLKWKEEYSDYKDVKFFKEKKLCDMNSLVLYSKTLLLWLFPIQTFKSFKKVIILTYMFESQIQYYYYKFFGINFNYWNITESGMNSYKFTLEEDKKNILDYKSLIHILDDYKMNYIGNLEYSLSRTWYYRNRNNIILDQLRKNTMNFFKHKIEVSYSKSDNNLWTTFKEYKSKIQGKGYTKGYVSLNLRSSNEYKDKTAVAYLVNRFFNPVIKNFFEQRGVNVDEEGYALSEMLQFLWRSGIREGKEITVYIPSKRMRNLLINWIEEMEMKKNE